MSDCDRMKLRAERRLVLEGFQWDNGIDHSVRLPLTVTAVIVTPYNDCPMDRRSLTVTQWATGIASSCTCQAGGKKLPLRSPPATSFTTDLCYQTWFSKSKTGFMFINLCIVAPKAVLPLQQSGAFEKFTASNFPFFENLYKTAVHHR